MQIVVVVWFVPVASCFDWSLPVAPYPTFSQAHIHFRQFLGIHAHKTSFLFANSLSSSLQRILLDSSSRHLALTPRYVAVCAVFPLLSCDYVDAETDTMGFIRTGYAFFCCVGGVRRTRHLIKYYYHFQLHSAFHFHLVPFI